MCSNIDLSSFSGQDFDKGAGVFKISAWYFVNALIVNARWNPFMKVKIILLKLFGAKIGAGLVIKNGVNIKYPWKLRMGENVWLGEDVWIDNLDYVTIGSNVCVSQGALLLTGNHDYAISSFCYRNAPIVVEDGVWLGAKTIVCPGIVCGSHSILTVGSVATKNMEYYSVYQGNPARFIRKRQVQTHNILLNEKKS